MDWKLATRLHADDADVSKKYADSKHFGDCILKFKANIISIKNLI